GNSPGHAGSAPRNRPRQEPPVRRAGRVRRGWRDRWTNRGQSSDESSRSDVRPATPPTPASVSGCSPERVTVHDDRSTFALLAALARQGVLTVALIARLAIVVIGAVAEAALAGVLLALLLGTLAVLRAVLPTRAVGALAVRSRFLDVSGLLVMAIALAVLSTSPNL